MADVLVLDGGGDGPMTPVAFKGSRPAILTTPITAPTFRTRVPDVEAVRGSSERWAWVPAFAGMTKEGRE
ncbi:MAG: hypothetical protein ACREF1_03155 [Acetobacteraceae bacterium]